MSGAPSGPDPRIRGRIPTLTEVLEVPGGRAGSAATPAASSANRPFPLEPPFLDLGDTHALTGPGQAAPTRVMDERLPAISADGVPPLEPIDRMQAWPPVDVPGGDAAPLKSEPVRSTDVAAGDTEWVDALMERIAPQIEQVVRDAMRDAQFAALAQVRLALRPAIEALVRTAAMPEARDRQPSTASETDRHAPGGPTSWR